MEPVRSLALIVNPNKQGAAQSAELLLEEARRSGVHVVQQDKGSEGTGFLKQVDACCTIGGDGTLLSVVQEAVREQTPILGINCGKLGFMTAFSAAEAKEKFSVFLQGHCQIEHRLIFECCSANNTDKVWALNDVVVKVEGSRLTGFTVFSGTELVNRYAGDGLIFCTPTGSTAYNLSAGGPLIDPRAEVIAMTPICAHTLSNRSVIFNRNAVLKVALDEVNQPVHVSRDGQVCFSAQEDFPFTLSIASQYLKLVHLPDYSHYQMVRAKLGWG